jgi:hypothetical protein
MKTIDLMKIYQDNIIANKKRNNSVFVCWPRPSILYQQPGNKWRDIALYW